MHGQVKAGLVKLNFPEVKVNKVKILTNKSKNHDESP